MNKRCEAEGCKTQANWGMPQERAGHGGVLHLSTGMQRR